MGDLKNVNGRLLRCGCTTGSCAALAAKASAHMLLSGGIQETASIVTPRGIRLEVPVLDVKRTGVAVSCAVRKDAGDDPDITDGILVYVRVSRLDSPGITVDGGAGVGRVTKPGLDQPVGAAAINRVPREMIAAEVQAVCDALNYKGGLSVVVSIPGGESLSKRTFNPRLGIEGGISILGTTGIVEPMSSRALADTLRLELRQLSETGARAVLLTPGSYGEAFCRDGLSLSLDGHISCSNYIGDAIDGAVEAGFDKLLLVGHIGKLVKLGIGLTNTHSSFGDGRMETLLACALEAEAKLPVLKAVLQGVTTDAGLEALHNAGLLERTMELLGRRIGGCLVRRVPEGVDIGYVCYTNAGAWRGVLAQSANAGELMKIWRKP